MFGSEDVETHSDKDQWRPSTTFEGKVADPGESQRRDDLGRPDTAGIVVDLLDRVLGTLGLLEPEGHGLLGI